LERGQSTVIASGPAAVAAIVTEAGMCRRRRMSGIATEATTVAAAAARTSARVLGLDLLLLPDLAK
jgi:hypothetical protein